MEKSLGVKSKKGENNSKFYFKNCAGKEVQEVKQIE
jgi:hypothetical protein